MKLAEHPCSKQKNDAAHDHLVLQRLGHRLPGQWRESDCQRCCRPGKTSQQAHNVAPEHAIQFWRTCLSADECDDHTGECQRDAEPLKPPHPFRWDFPLQTQRNKNRSGVDENNHMRGRCIPQPLGDQKVFGPKQAADKNAWFPGWIPKENALSPSMHEDRNEHRRDDRAKGNLHDGCHVGRSQFQNDLLKPPDQA